MTVQNENASHYAFISLILKVFMLKRWFFDVKSAYSKFSSNHGFLLAGASSFYLLFSLVPLLLLVSWMVGFVIQREVITLFLLNTIQSLFGSSMYSLSSYLLGIAESGTPALRSFTSLALLYLGIHAFLNSMRTALKIVWGKPVLKKERGTILQEIHLGFRNVIVIILSAALVLLFTALMILASYLRLGLASLFGPTTWVLQGITYLFIIIFLTCFIYYVFFRSSEGKFSKRVIFRGSLITALLVLIGQALISTYFSIFFTDDALVLGPLAVLLWVYYTLAVFIYGAELTSVLACRENNKNGKRH